MTAFDIFNPQISTVARGLEGKVITIVGSNNLGKTKQATRMKKPFYLGFEKGIRAIAGIPFLPINDWADFKKINRQLTSKKNREKAREMYQTIIFDEVYTSALYCQDHLCRIHGVDSIGDGNNGYGLWKEYEKEFWTEIDKLINSGFTLVFISHETEVGGEGKDKNKKIPKGDKRSIKPIIDNSDIVVYLTSNGVDEDKNVIPSSAWFAETEYFFARSRFDYIDTYLEEFSAENLEKVITEAIERQEEAEGIKAVSFDIQKDSYASEELDFEGIKKQLSLYGNLLVENGLLDEVVELMDKHLGKGKTVKDAKPSQVDLLSLLLLDMEDLAEDNKLELE